MLNEAYNNMKVEKELTAPLPKHRVDEIEVFAASVHAVVHEHDWRLVSSQVRVTNPFKLDMLFQCASCKELLAREGDRLI